MAYVCAELTTEQTCVSWVEHQQLIPELSNEAIAQIWLWFFVGMFMAWGFKHLINMFLEN